MPGHEGGRAGSGASAEEGKNVVVVPPSQGGAPAGIDNVPMSAASSTTKRRGLAKTASTGPAGAGSGRPSRQRTPVNSNAAADKSATRKAVKLETASARQRRAAAEPSAGGGDDFLEPTGLNPLLNQSFENSAQPDPIGAVGMDAPIEPSNGALDFAEPEPSSQPALRKTASK